MSWHTWGTVVYGPTTSKRGTLSLASQSTSIGNGPDLLRVGEPHLLHDLPASAMRVSRLVGRIHRVGRLGAAVDKHFKH